MNTCNVTIPLRPEIRPGYPVYIPYMDTFYYISGVSHTFGYQSSCQTTLTLTAKRNKFFAPGKPREFGIDSIKLDQTSLPERPLKVLDNEGHPKLEGFPNVVMALDPEGVNPLYFLQGSDLNDLSNPNTAKKLITMAVDYNIIQYDSVSETYTIPLSQETYQVVGEGTPGENPSATSQTNGITFTKEELATQIGTYVRIKKNIGDTIQSRTTEINALNNDLQTAYSELAVLQTSLSELDADDPENSSAIADLHNQVSNKNRTIEQINKNLDALMANINQQMTDEVNAFMATGNMAAVSNLMDEVGKKYMAVNDDYPEPGSTAAYLEILSDKKSSFGNTSLPGYFTYFSSSHPLPKYQAPMNLKSNADGPEASGYSILENREVSGFVLTPQKPGPDGQLPEAEKGPVKVVNGFNIIRPGQGASIVDSTEIKTLCFVKHDFEKDVKLTEFKYGTGFPGLTEANKQAIISDFQKVRFSSSSIFDLFNPVWQSWVSSYNSETLSYFPDIIMGIPTSDTVTEDNFSQIALALASTLASSIGIYFRDLWASTVEIFDASTQPSDRIRAEKNFSKTINTKKLTYNIVLSEKGSKEKARKVLSYSPVFPVSDRNGYKVVGSYQYGRDLDIAPNSTLAQISMQDPFSFASPEAVQNYLDNIGKNLNTLGQMDTSNVNKAVTDAEQALVASIRSNPSAPDELIQRLAKVESQTDMDLSNWIADAASGTFKLSVANAAYTLADLQSFVKKDICSCVAMQNSILLELAFNEGNFISVDPNNIGDLEKAATQNMLDKSVSWKNTQDILRGGVTAKHETLADNWNDLKDSVNTFSDNLYQSKEELSDNLKDLDSFGTGTARFTSGTK
jgi:hypothetical protein